MKKRLIPALILTCAFVLTAKTYVPILAISGDSPQSTGIISTSNITR